MRVLSQFRKVILSDDSAVMFVLLFSVFFVYPAWLTPTKDHDPFYVGVTFCGNTPAEAKQLIDKAKPYTNLFVVQSDPLQKNITALEETCDYAVKSGLDIIVYFGYSAPWQSETSAVFLETAQARYGGRFLGVYYGDEPGGKMLDAGQIHLYPTGDTINGSITKDPDGTVTIGEEYTEQLDSNRTVTAFQSSGEIILQIFTKTVTPQNSSQEVWKSILYQPNGTITYYEGSRVTDDIYAQIPNYTETSIGPLTYQPDGAVQDENGTVVTDRGDISQFEPYPQVLDSNPLQNSTKVADVFVKSQQSILVPVKNQSYTLFTSDYALHWWDYQGGYDAVFAELGWNYTAAKELG
jgi:hypothetical protein